MQYYIEDSSAVDATDEAAGGASTVTSGGSDPAGHDIMPGEYVEDGTSGGREEGALLAQIRTVVRKIGKGLDLPEKADYMEMDVDEIRPVWEAVKASSPGSSREQILQMLLYGDAKLD